MMFEPRQLAVVLGFLATVASRRAAASDLSWSGPPECRQSEQLSFQVERALGAPLAATGRVHLQVHVDRVSPDARALLRIASQVGDAGDAGVKERLLVAPDCMTLVDTLAIAIALAVEATVPTSSTPPTVPASARSDSAEPALSRNTVPSTPALNDQRRAEETVAARGSGPLPSVSALLLGDLGSLPGPALGVALGVELAWSHVQLAALGTLWLAQHTLVPGSSVVGAGADVRLATGTLLACANPLGSAREQAFASLCAGWETGTVTGSGSGVSRPRQANALWLAPSLLAGVSWTVPDTRLVLSARAGAAVPLERNRFFVEGLGTAYQPSRLAARAGLGIGVAFE